MGASLIGASASLGFNNQASTITLQVVEDLRNGQSFNTPTVGTPANITIGSFSFAGLVQRWRKNRSVSGNPVYEVTLVDPRELLEGTQLILSGYSGEVSIPNILNCYGYHEDTGFGNSFVNDAGMSWNLIKEAVETLTQEDAGEFGGPLKLKGYSYSVDLSDLPNAPSTYRIGGSITMSLMDVINEVAAAGGFDYYITLVGSAIRVNRIDRYNQPSIGAMSAYVDARTQAGDSTGGNLGMEFRNETVAAMVIGGPVELLHLTQTLVPFWGFDFAGNPIIGSGVGDDHTAQLNASSISDLIGSVTYSCAVAEMRLALFSREMWESYVASVKPDLANTLSLRNSFAIKRALGNVNAPEHIQNMAFNIDPNDVHGTDILTKQTRMYEFVRQQAETYYGKKFLVQLPIIEYKIEPETNRLITSYDINKGGYLPEGAEPLGLDVTQSDIFQDSEGRFVAFAKFGNDTDIQFQAVDPANSYAQMDEMEQFEALYMHAEVDEQMVFTASGVAAILTVSRPPYIKSPNDIPFDVTAIKKIFPDQDPVELVQAFERILKRANFGGDVKIGMAYEYAQPGAVAIPLKSNTTVYGPWYAYSIDGKVAVQNNNSLVPWNFNGYSLLNTAGQAEGWGSVTMLQENESGSFEVAGTPAVSLGGTLVSGGSNITNIDITYDAQQGYKTNYRFETYTPRFGALAKSFQKRIETLGQSQRQANRNLRKLNRDRKLKADIVAGAQRGFWENMDRKWRGQTPHDAIGTKLITAIDGTSTSSCQASLATLFEIGGTLDKNSSEEYQKCAAMSLTGLIRPFSTRTADSYLPSFVPDDAANIKTSICTSGLNPFDTGHDVAFHTYGNDNDDLEADNADPDNSRLVGLRGPMVVVGWGYDMSGAITPSVDNYKKKSHLWKAGPVDLIWDQFRGVWSCNNKLLGILDGPCLASGNATMSIWGSGNDTSYNIQVYNWFSAGISGSTRVQAEYFPYANRWYITGADCI